MKKWALLVANNGPELCFGGGQRILMTIKILESQGYEVEMLILFNKVWGTYDENSELIKNWKAKYGLVKYFQLSFKNPYIPNYFVVKWLMNVHERYSKIIIRDETTAFKAGFYLMPKSKIIIDLNDFLLPHIKGFRKIKYFPLHWLLKYNISQAWVLIKNQKKYFGEKGYCVPNLPLNLFYDKEICFIKERSAIPTAIFVSSYLKGFESFLEAADKYIRLIPSFKLIIISKAITESLKNKFNSDQYLWINNAENISEYYSKAWISIVPGYKKDGPLIKFIESIYFQTPVVCTIVSLNGYEIFNEKENLIPNSNNVEEFVKHMESLLVSQSELDIRSQKLKLILDKNFSLNSIVESLRN